MAQDATPSSNYVSRPEYQRNNKAVPLMVTPLDDDLIGPGLRAARLKGIGTR
jgi:hypothetical protein